MWSLIPTLLLPALSLAVKINFGGSSSSQDLQEDLNNRGGSSNGNKLASDVQCCCVPNGLPCVEQLNTINQGELDLVGQGFINERIVNRPPGSDNLKCTGGDKLCCYTSHYEYDYSVFGRSCVAPTDGGKTNGNYGSSSGNNGNYGSSSGNNGNYGSSSGNYGSSSGNYGEWREQNCRSYASGECGKRDYRGAVSGLNYGESSPGEFPWTCLILNTNNDFLGTCAIIPERSDNSLSRGTRKIITAAHNLKNISNSAELKIRVGEYRADGFSSPEVIRHEEYSVSQFRKHHQFDAKRLDNDIAVIKVDRDINLNHRYVNAACMPQCDGQFDYQFSNGTGTRCWVAGWGKNEFDGSFQFVQHKVDVPIVDRGQCNQALKRKLNEQQFGVGDRFNLSPSELCAGTETGKDACTGDGGSPLVCEAASGRWTVVGLVSWGIGCATEVPGVYVNVGYFKSWIDQQ